MYILYTYTNWHYCLNYDYANSDLAWCIEFPYLHYFCVCLLKLEFTLKVLNSYYDHFDTNLETLALILVNIQSFYTTPSKNAADNLRDVYEEWRYRLTNRYSIWGSLRFYAQNILRIFLTIKIYTCKSTHTCVSERVTNSCENIVLNGPIKVIIYSCQTQYYDVVYS